MLIQKFSALLLYLVVALPVACWALRRHRLRHRVAPFLVLLPLLFTGRALLTGKVFGASDLAYAKQPFAAAADRLGVEELPPPILHDLYTMIIPGQRAVRHAWSQGEWPLWNPFIHCGQSLAGVGQTAPFYPPHLLGLLLSLPMSLGYSASLHLFLAALGAFLLARELGAGEAASLLAAAGWMAMNGNVFWVQWPLGMTMVLLPLVLLGTRRLVRDPGWRSCLLLSGVFSLGLLAGHPETSAHHLWVGVAWAVWELVSHPLRRWPRRMAWAALGGFLTVGVTAIFLFPMVDGLLQSSEWAQRGSLGMAPAATWREAVGRLLSNYFPFVQAPTPTYRSLSTSLFGAYCGSVLMAPALYGLWRSRVRERWPLAALGVVGLVAGAKVPVLYPALDFLPLLDRSINERLVALAGLSLPLLAALGIEAWRAEAEPNGMRRVALATTSSLGLATALLWNSLRAQGFAVEALPARVALFLVPPVLWLLVLARPRWNRHALAALLVLLVAQRAGEMGGYHPVAPVERFYPAITPLNEPALGEGIYRTIGMGPVLLPNQGTHYGLEDIRGYDAVHHGRFHLVSRLWTADPPLWFGWISDHDAPILSFLNVRWALLPRRQRPGPRWRLARRGDGAHLWENREVVERAFLPQRVRPVQRLGQTLDGLRRAQEPAAVAWIEPPEGLALPEGESANGRGEVTLDRDGLGYRLQAQLEDPAWIVVSDVAWRGWRARSDGRELPLGVANLAFLGLHLPAGSHSVELYFRPRSFEVGLAVTACTLGGLLLGLGLGVYRARSSRFRPSGRIGAGGG